MKERRSSVNILSDLARKSRERRQTEAPYWRVGSGEQGSRLHGWSQEKKYYSEEGFREVHRSSGSGGGLLDLNGEGGAELAGSSREAGEGGEVH